jgi:hypothetical protein
MTYLETKHMLIDVARVSKAWYELTKDCSAYGVLSVASFPNFFTDQGDNLARWTLLNTLRFDVAESLALGLAPCQDLDEYASTHLSNSLLNLLLLHAFMPLIYRSSWLRLLTACRALKRLSVRGCKFAGDGFLCTFHLASLAFPSCVSIFRLYLRQPQARMPSATGRAGHAKRLSYHTGVIRPGLLLCDGRRLTAPPRPP